VAGESEGGERGSRRGGERERGILGREKGTEGKGRGEGGGKGRGGGLHHMAFRE